MPVFDVQRNADDVAFFQNADFAVPLLITSFAAQHQQNLAAAVLVPVGSGSRLKGNIGQGRIPGRVVGTETGQISLSGKKRP